MAMLSVIDLTKNFGGLTAVDHVSFSLQEGEIVGLIGPNGAGKTTVFNMISGFIPPTAGKILYRNRLINGLKPHQICKLGITRTFQIAQPFPDLTVLENIMVGAYIRYATVESAKRKAYQILERIGLLDKAEQLGRDLTLLELKRLEIGKALASEPRLLLLDEVAAGLKDVEVEVILDLIRQLNQEGMTILIVEHLMKVIMSISLRIIVLDFGKMIAEGVPSEIAKNPVVIEAYLGQDN